MNLVINPTWVISIFQVIAQLEDLALGNDPVLHCCGGKLLTTAAMQDSAVANSQISQLSNDLEMPSSRL